MSYTANPRFLTEPEGGGPEQLPSRESQTPAYAATVALSVTRSTTTVLMGLITGALTLTVNTIPGTAGNIGTGCFDGDELIVKLPADVTGRTVTFGTGFTAQSSTIVLGSNVVGIVKFVYDGATSKWVETGRNILVVSTVGGNNTFTGNNTFSGNNAFTGNDSFAGQIVKVQTPYTTGTDTTAGWTLAEVTKALKAGILKSTTAAGVTTTLDSVANIITGFAGIGITLATGSEVPFILDNSQGSNTLTLAVDGGATITAAKQTSSGDTATSVLLTVAAGAVGRFALYITSATTAILFRVG